MVLRQINLANKRLELRIRRRKSREAEVIATGNDNVTYQIDINAIDFVPWEDINLTYDVDDDIDIHNNHDFGQTIHKTMRFCSI